MVLVETSDECSTILGQRVPTISGPGSAFCSSAAVNSQLNFPREYVEESNGDESERGVFMETAKAMIKKNWPG